MAHNAVTLVKRTAGGIKYWDARWWDPRTGKRRGKSLGRCDKVSQRQARRQVARIEHEFEKDPHARCSEGPPRLGQWLELFYNRQAAKGRKEATLRDYRLVRAMLEEFFGSKRKLDVITKFDLEQFRLAVANGKLRGVHFNKTKLTTGPTTVTKYMRNVQAIFSAAYDDDLLARNPAANLKLAAPPAQSWRKVDADTFWTLYDAVDDDYPPMRPLLALCRLAALRKCDAMALRWSNVRWEEGVLCFRPIKVERFAKRDARVPICQELRDILDTQRSGPMRIDGFVVPRGLPDTLGRKVFPKLFERAGLEPWPYPLHTLRKSCVDDWAKVAAPNVVMEWATHANIATTMKYYTMVSPGDEAVGQGNLFGENTDIERPHHAS